MEISREEYEALKSEIEELKSDNEELKLIEQVYRISIGLTDNTITYVDIKNRTLNQVQNDGEWTGISVAMDNAPESIIATGIIHPDDCDGYRKFYEDIYNGVPFGSYTMRTMEENRGWVWFEMKYQTVFDGKGEPIRAICFSSDITLAKKAESQYKHYKNVITKDANFVWEANLTNDYMISEDDFFKDIFDYRDRQTYTELNDIAVNMISEDMRDEIRSCLSRESLLSAYKEGHRDITNLMYKTDFHDGMGERWMNVDAHLMTNAKDEVVVIICVNDVTQNYQEKLLLEMKAERDQLTGLYNRASMMERAGKVLLQFNEEPHGFMIFDIDNFKDCNDTYGHAYGDEILVTVARTMSETFRATDILCRLGGDEFVVFMQLADSKKIVVQRGEELREALKKVSKDLRFKINISVGATLSRPGESVQDIYLRMDEALYDSKEAGKDRLTFTE